RPKEHSVSSVSADPNAAVVATDEATTATRRKVPTLLVLNVITIFLGLGVWWLLSLLGLQIPGPPEVVVAAIDLATSGILLQDIAASLLRVFSGFLLGTLLAIPVRSEERRVGKGGGSWRSS